MQPQNNKNSLALWIHCEIKEHGPVTFARFMEWALYQPQLGYYSTGPDIGPKGDFTTSPEASPAFGRLIARHVAEIDRLLGSPAILDIVECGPGLGTLARDLLDMLRAMDTAIYDRARYWLVEISPALVVAQQAKLTAHTQKCRWAASIAELPLGLQGALIANEFVDAFPVHVVEERKDGLKEHYVESVGNGELDIAYGPLSTPELSDFVERAGVSLAKGERLEVNLAVNKWLADLPRTLQRGVITIIDYGDTRPQRYSEARKEGTLLAYYAGMVTDKALAHPGEQDLTALVDFTALEEAAAEAGMSLIGATRQSNFLVGLGLGTAEALVSGGDNIAAELAYRQGALSLISPEGLGRFHVLLLGNNIDAATAGAALSGLKYADIV
ncbi:MAG: SAM-dependent methyltransferase [Chloroflexi bacterium]|nr:SAM-dependent methyltransferase [Chloroflexota bacterium]